IAVVLAPAHRAVAVDDLDGVAPLGGRARRQRPGESRGTCRQGGGGDVVLEGEEGGGHGSSQVRVLGVWSRREATALLLDTAHRDPLDEGALREEEQDDDRDEDERADGHQRSERRVALGALEERQTERERVAGAVGQIQQWPEQITPG